VKVKEWYNLKALNPGKKQKVAEDVEQSLSVGGGSIVGKMLDS
jgi:hypothetical protein